MDFFAKASAASAASEKSRLRFSSLYVGNNRYSKRQHSCRLKVKRGGNAQNSYGN